MKKISFLFFLMMVFTLTFTGCGGDSPNKGGEQLPGEGAEVHVFAAASLTDCLDEIIGEYQKGSPNTIVPVYEASGTLRQQIEEGADCDIFISANQKHMDTLETAGAIDPASRKDLLGNSLTLIASAGKADAIKALAEKDFASVFTGAEAEVISVGEPNEVPAGQYAREMLENLGIWEQVQSKIVFAQNVRAVLTYVDGGDADVGLVYHTDALELKSGKIIQDCPADAYTAVNYPSAILANAPEAEAASDFYDYLTTDTAKGIFEKYGFTVL